MIIVLLNNKLITCDTITPFLFEIAKRNPDRTIELICFHGPTYDAIRKNIVLWDAICSFGSLRLFGSRSYKIADRVPGRFKALLNLLRLYVLALSGKVDFIHFKALNFWPLKLAHVLNRGRTFYFQPSMAGITALERQVDNIAKLRPVMDIRPAATTVVGFQPDWDGFKYATADKQEKHVISAPCSRPVWTEYLQDRSHEYLGEIGISPDTRFITYILSSMCTNGWLRNPDDFPILFDETLEILGAVCPDVPIIIKPHPVTLPHNIKLQKEIMERHKDVRMCYADINPMLLTSQSSFFISNGYSSTFTMAKEAGVQTIEYTDPCEEILQSTNGGSMRPDMVDHFIRRDPDQLKSVINTLLEGPQVKKTKPVNHAFEDEYETLLSQLTH